jgi:hypothetical protein
MQFDAAGVAAPALFEEAELESIQKAPPNYHHTKRRSLLIP